jgi:hypothetical protein
MERRKPEVKTTKRMGGFRIQRSFLVTGHVYKASGIPSAGFSGCIFDFHHQGEKNYTD